MTFEEMQSEMIKRGATRQTTNGVTARMCYDILSGAGTVFEDIPKAEKDLDEIKRECERERRFRSRDLEALKERERTLRELSATLQEAETPEARDKLRLAEYYKQTLQTERDKDFTAGLAKILAAWSNTRKDAGGEK